MSFVLKALVSIGTKLLTEALIEELVVFTLDKISKSTKSKADDELVAMVKKHLK